MIPRLEILPEIFILIILMKKDNMILGKNPKVFQIGSSLINGSSKKHIE